MLALPILDMEASPISTRGIVRIAVCIYVMKVLPQKRDHEAKVGTGGLVVEQRIALETLRLGFSLES